MTGAQATERDGAAPAALSRLSVSAITLPDEPFDDDVALLARHGLGGIGLWEYKLEGLAIEHVAESLRRHGLRATNCIAVGNSVFPYALSPEPAEPRARVEALRRRIERLAPLAPESLVVITGPAPTGDAERALELSRAALSTLAATAADAGVRLALEAMHPSVAHELCLFSSVETAAAAVRQVASPALGLLVDSWHLGQDERLAVDLARNRDLLYGVHLADHRPGAAGWTDRAFPGEGLGEAARLVSLLDELGFSGSLDVEIFSDDGRYGRRLDHSLWRLPPDEIVRRCTAGLVPARE